MTSEAIRGVGQFFGGRTILGGALLLLLSAPPLRSQPALVDNSFDAGYGADGPILKLHREAVTGGLVVAGLFSRIDNVPRPFLARLSAEGVLVPAFDPGTALSNLNDVLDLVIDTQDRVLISARFMTADGSLTNRLLRFLPDGSVDSDFEFTLGPNDLAHSVLPLLDDKLLIGGSMVIAADVTYTNLARLNSDGSVDGSFPATLQPNGPVQALALAANGAIWIGGTFGRVAGQLRSKLARIHGDWTLAPSLASSLSQVTLIHVGPDGSVAATDGGRIQVFLEDGGAPTGFSIIDTPGWVRSLAIQPNGKIIAGGSFIAPGVHLARFRADGSLDLEYASQALFDDQVYGIALQADGRLVVAGAFFRINDEFYFRLGRLFGDEPVESAPRILRQPLDTTFVDNGDMWLQVRVAAHPTPISYQWYQDGQPLTGATYDAFGYYSAPPSAVGSYFVIASNDLGSVTSRVAQVSLVPTPIEITRQPVGTTVLELSDVILEVEAKGTSPIACQWLKDGVEIPGATSLQLFLSRARPDQSGSYAARLTNPAGIELSQAANVTIQPLPPQPNHPGAVDVYRFLPGVRSDLSGSGLIRLADGRLLFHGSEINHQGLIAPYLRRLHPNGTLDASFSFTFAPNALSIAPPLELLSGKLLLLVWTTSDTTEVIRLLPDGERDLSFAPTGPIDGPGFLAVEQHDGKLVIGGRFTMAAGATRQNLVRLNQEGGVDLGFFPQTTLNYAVVGLAVQADDRVLFTEFSSCCAPARLVTRLQASGLRDTTFNPTVGAVPPAPPFPGQIIVQADGKIIVAGDFDTVNDQSRSNLVRLSPTGATDTTFNIGQGPDDQVFVVTMLEDGSLLLGGRFTVFNGIARKMLARISASGSVDPSLFIPDDPADATFSSIRQLVPLADGALAVWGDFDMISGIPRKSFAILRGSPATTPSTQPVLVQQGFDGSGRFELQLGGKPGRAYRVQGTTDLINWFNVIDYTAEPVRQGHVDPSSGSLGPRIYRVVPKP